MKLRTLVLAVVVLAAFSLIAYVANRPVPASPADPRVGKPVLNTDVASKAAGITITDQGKKVDLTRGPDGTWRVPSYYDFPADVDKIAQLAKDLNEARIERLVTSNPDRIARLEFKGSSIAMTDSAGKTIWDLSIGKTSETGNGRFIRYGDEPVAFYSPIHIWLDTDAKGWASSQLVGLKPEDVASVGFTFDGAPPVTVSRTKKDAAWTSDSAPKGRAVSADKISSLLATLTGLSFSDTSDPRDPSAVAAADHERTFTLKTFDGRTISVALGRKPEEKKPKPPPAAKPEPAPEKPGEEKPAAKPAAPEFETLPAGPVFAVVASSDTRAAVNAMMKQRAFQVDEYVYSGLPQKPDELFEAPKAK